MVFRLARREKGVWRAISYRGSCAARNEEEGLPKNLRLKKAKVVCDAIAEIKQMTAKPAQVELNL